MGATGATIQEHPVNRVYETASIVFAQSYITEGVVNEAE